MFHKLLSRLVVITSVFTLCPLFALQPNERASADGAFYIEGAPLGENIAALKAVVSAVGGESAWNLLTASVEAKGLYLLDTEQLEEAGVDIKTTWGVAVDKLADKTDSTAKPQFVIIIPSRNTGKLFTFLKEKFTAAELANMNEIEAGKILAFGTEEDPGYLVTAGDAVLLGNNLAMAKQMVKRASSPISKANYYTSIRTHFISKNAGKPPFLAFYFNPKLLFTIFDTQTEFLNNLRRSIEDGNADTKLIDDNAPYVKELRENLEASGGALIVQNDRLSSYFSYKYKTGYLNDTSKIYPRILQVKTQPLSSDTLAASPVHYSLFKINVLAVIDLLKSLSPEFNEKYARAIQEAKDNTQIDIEKQVLNTLRGNFNFQLFNIPTQKRLKDVTAWEMSGSFGIKNGTAKAWLDTFKAVEKQVKVKESKQPQKTQFSYEKHDEGNFVYIKTQEKTGKTAKTFTVAFLIRENEIVVANGKAVALKAIKGSESTLSERLLRLPYDNTQAIFFVDLQRVLKAAKSTQEGGTLKAYIGMLEKLKHFSIVSNIEGDFVTADFSLQLKK